jgi:FkbM family methyltransferase
MVRGMARRGVRWLGVRLCRRLRRDYVTGFAVRPRADLVRLGDDYGGWVVPQSLLGKDAVVYCVGCGENISFDLALIANFGCVVHALDPTPRAVAFVKRAAGDEPHYRFECLGLWDESTHLRFYAPRDPSHVSHSLLNLQQTDTFIEVPVARLSQVLERHGHHRVTLLKLDIEGAEYKVLQSVLDDHIPIAILCVEFDEFHHPIDRHYRSRIQAALRQLQRRGYTIVDAYAGNYTLVHTAA